MYSPAKPGWAKTSWKWSKKPQNPLQSPYIKLVSVNQMQMMILGLKSDNSTRPARLNDLSHYHLKIVVYAYWHCVWSWLQFLLYTQYILVGWFKAQRPGLSVDSNHRNQTSLETSRHAHLNLDGGSWTGSRGKSKSLWTFSRPKIFI